MHAPQAGSWRLAGPAGLPRKEAHPLRVVQDGRPAVGLEKLVIGSCIPHRLGSCLPESVRLRTCSQGRASAANMRAQAMLLCSEQDLIITDETYLLAIAADGKALLRRRTLSARVPVRRRRLRPLRLALRFRDAQLTCRLQCRKTFTIRGL